MQRGDDREIENILDEINSKTNTSGKHNAGGFDNIDVMVEYILGEQKMSSKGIAGVEKGHPVNTARQKQTADTGGQARVPSGEIKENEYFKIVTPPEDDYKKRELSPDKQTVSPVASGNKKQEKTPFVSHGSSLAGSNTGVSSGQHTTGHRGLDDANAFFEELKKKAAEKNTENQPVAEPIIAAEKTNTIKKNSNEHKTAQPYDGHTRVLDKVNIGKSDFEAGHTITVTLPAEAVKVKSGEITGQITIPGFENKESALSDTDPEISEIRLKKAKEFRLQNSAIEPEDDDYDEAVENKTEEPAAADYEKPSDQSRVRIDLILRARAELRRVLFSSVLFLFMLIVFFADTFKITSLSPVYSPNIHIITTLCLLVLSAAFNYRAAFGGLFGCLRAAPDLDSPAALCFAAALIQGICVLVFKWDVSVTGLLGASSVLCFITGGIGKYSMIKRISDNFNFICADREKYCVSQSQKGNISFELGRGLAIGDAPVVCDCAADIPSGFLKNSFEEDRVDIAAQRISPFIPVAAVLCALICVFFGPGGRSFSAAVNTFCFAVVICSPLTSLVGVNLFMRKECRKLQSDGVMLSGTAAADKYADTDVAAIDAAALFPEGTVQLINIKSSGTVPIDRVLIDAAGVSLSAGGPLVHVFKSILGGKTDMLPQVDTLVFEEKMGVSGWVNGRRVLIGNRELMDYHGIWVPDADIIKRYENDGLYTVFLSDSGMLSAIFFLKYTADEDIAGALRDAERKGMGFSVYSVDPNVNEKMICRLFSLSEHSVRVMAQSARRAYKQALTDESTRTAGLLHIFDAGSLVRAVLACRKVRGRVSFFGVLQTVAMLGGLLLTFAAALSSPVTALGAAGVLIYQAAVLVITLLADAVL